LNNGVSKKSKIIKKIGIVAVGVLICVILLRAFLYEENPFAIMTQYDSIKIEEVTDFKKLVEDEHKDINLTIKYHPDDRLIIRIRSKKTIEEEVATNIFVEVGEYFRNETILSKIHDRYSDDEKGRADTMIISFAYKDDIVDYYYESSGSESYGFLRWYYRNNVSKTEGMINLNDM